MDRQTLLVLALLLAPGALVVIVALLRGYDLTVILRRDKDK